MIFFFQVIPLETRMKQFRDLLTEKEISAFSTWEKELHKIVFDPRYLLLTSRERKQVFDKYVRERAEEERKEKKSRLKEKRDAYRQLLEDYGVHGKSSFSEFASKNSKDDRFKGIEKMREREALFNEYQVDVRKKEKEEKEARRKTAKKDFLALLKETEAIDRHSHWSEVKKSIDSDPRYKAVESSNQREDWFLDYVHDLKEEHRREKDKKKKNKDRSRSRSRSPRGKKRSRSRSKSRENKKSKKKDKKRSRSRSRDRKRDREEKEGKARTSEKEEGEMSDDADDKRKSVDEKEKEKEQEDGGSGRNSREGSKDKDSDGNKEEKMEGEETEEQRVERERKEKEDRVAASLRAREEEVQKELSGHLHARDKERQQHRHQEAVGNFQALLADLIRHPDYSWKEAKKMLKKDGRYDSVSSLEKSERERLFDEHIDHLIAKKKENYWKLLAECKEITLDSTFKEIKKLIRDDPRYSKYSSSERKCEKQFNEFLKDKVSKAKQAFRELLMETKKITDKSLSVVKEEGDQGADSGHMAEILELLNKDRRYLDLESMADERSKILMQYLEDQERRGPPPPPTASEPGRRTVK